MTPVIYFDLDGVLVDFVGGAIRHHKSDLRHDDAMWGLEAQMGLDPATFWKNLDRSFWAFLDPYPDGMTLLAAAEALVGADNIALLSSPCDTAGCCDGKRDWVTQHLPAYRQRLILGSAKHLLAAPNKCLIDDHSDNWRAFRGAGGHAVIPPRPWNHRTTATIMPGGLFSVPEVVAELTAAINAVRNTKG